MGAVARTIESGSTLPRTGPVASRQQSKLFPAMFKMMNVNHRLTVLEIGPAMTETVDFFSQFKCRLHFVDLFHEPFVREKQSDFAGTRAHGFGVHHLAIKLENIQYGVINKETLSIRERRSAQLPYHPHSQIEMHEMVTNFDFERGLLLPEGILEMLLKPRI